TISTRAPPGSGSARSRIRPASYAEPSRRPFPSAIRMASAARASPAPIEAARSAPAAPSGSSRTEPAGGAPSMTGAGEKPRRDGILTSDQEHPGLLGPLRAARDRGGEVRMVAVRDLDDAVGPRPRVVACSHVSWVGGEAAPAALAETGVPVVLDGAQGIGA